MKGFDVKEVNRKYKKYSEYIDRDLFDRPESIHGISHSERVLYLSLIVSSEMNLSEMEEKALAYAALYHDIGREHDGKCLKHGYVSVEKLNHYNKYSKRKLFPVSKKSRYYGEEIIKLHCIGDGLAFKVIDKIDDENRRDQAKFLLMIFKDMDGLDRLRVNDLNKDFLRTKEALDMVDIAKELFEKFPEGNIEI